MDVCISKREVIELCDWYEHEFCEAEYCIRLLAEEIKELQTIEAQSVRQGHWKLLSRPLQIWICDQCSATCSSFYMGKPSDKYCRMCGAKMTE